MGVLLVRDLQVLMGIFGRAVAFAVIAALLAGGVALLAAGIAQRGEAPTRPVIPTPIPVDGDRIAEEVWRLANEARESRGLRPLLYGDALEDMAQAHAENMLAQFRLSHVLDRVGLAGRVRLAGLPRCGYGENIHYIRRGDSRSMEIAQRLHDDWMDSDGHRANILSGSWRRMGVGVASKKTVTDDYSRIYAAVNFADC